MKTTVILCTYNRGESLAQSLASLAVSELPDDVDWEVLIVDNNSTDGTRDIVRDFCARHRRFRYLYEPRQGKSHAANLGIAEARGDVIAFIDDDVTVEVGWLHNLTAALHAGSWAGAAGRILPQGDFVPPRWIPAADRYALAPLALFDPDLAAGPLSEPPFGANMAYRKDVFERYGGFRNDLGPGQQAGSPQKSEDSEFGHRLLAAGERLRYEPAAVVYHAVPEHRLRKRYFLDWWFDKARADVRAFGVTSLGGTTIAGVPMSAVRAFAVSLLRWWGSFEPGRRFGAKLRVWAAAGRITESRRIERAARTIVGSHERDESTPQSSAPK